jgi:uncharacterized protein YegP (UPF0339 family)
MTMKVASKDNFEIAKAILQNSETIAESKELIVSKDVADVPFLMELARTLEVVDRLAANEKIIFITNLFENMFFLTVCQGRMYWSEGGRI